MQLTILIIVLLAEKNNSKLSELSKYFQKDERMMSILVEFE